ncbi:MAG: hypothetical protein AB8B95_05835 [Pseudohongiellaceae bacterium]
MLVPTTLRKLLGLLAVTFSAGLYAQTEAPATVPSSFVGTYDLTFSSVRDGSSFANGAKVAVVIGSDNSLCIDGLKLNDPVFVNGNTAEAVWKDTSNSFSYAVSNFNGAFNEVNVLGLTFSPFYGQLKGSKVSDSTSCGAATTNQQTTTSTPVATATINQIFTLAESKLSQFFPAGAITATLDQYVYRFYPSTKVYLAFANDAVFLLGGPFGEAVVNAGSISTVLASLEAIEVPTTDTGTGSGSVDLWNLSISGSFSASSPFPITQAFPAISLKDLPAPDVSDFDAITREVTSSLEGVVSGAGSLSVTVITNTSNQRTFDVSFGATFQGLGAVTYNLRYDYTR